MTRPGQFAKSGGRRTGGLLKKLILLVAGLAILLGGGFFAWNRLRGAAESEGAEAQQVQAEEQQAEVETQTIALGEFLVNLQTGDGALRYLQTEMSIVAIPPEPDEEEAESGGGPGGASSEEAAEPQLAPASHRYARDVAIEVLSSQRFVELRDDPDRSKLKALLQQRLDEVLPEYSVQDVLFTSFVMQ